jgi:Dyp-type peroxidase family
VRLDLKPEVVGKVTSVRNGLEKLCTLFERIDNGTILIDIKDENGDLVLSTLGQFNFSTTVGFGFGFFEKLNIRREKRPRRLSEMPSHDTLGDPVQYVFNQTDMIIQIGSTKDFINRWILKTDSFPRTSQPEKMSQNTSISMNGIEEEIHDISTAIKEWALITDVHAGFQRLDGRNLLGFNDGTSQPDRLNNNVVWTTPQDETKELSDGTYMVFQKIEHDLEHWEKLSVDEQESWIGRSKGTGLLLGTLPKEEDEKLASDCRSQDESVRKIALSRLKMLIEEQRNPYTPFFNGTDPKYKNIQLDCPVWSHVRKSNPRISDDRYTKIIFRRGYLFMEDTVQPGRKLSSGLLFVCYQRDIRNGFEFIKQYLQNNRNFPVPEMRKHFTHNELLYRHKYGRFSEEELKRLGQYQKYVVGLDLNTIEREAREAKHADMQNTGKDALSGPSRLGVYPRGDFLVTVSLGGGYYFVPPIPNKRIAELGQQFFD